MWSNNRVAIIGGGLSGSESAYILSVSGISVDLFEMKPLKFSDAHRSENLAELVCSNSLKSNNPHNPQGLLKEEMRRFGSLIIEAADKNSIPSGDSLSVDRELFSRFVNERLNLCKGINIIRSEVKDIDGLRGKYSAVVVATGPLTSESLAKGLIRKTGGKEFMYFYDAISPIVTFDSIDMSKAFFGSRYNKGEDDYINCPLNEDEYKRLYETIINAEGVSPHIDEDLKFFEGCLPVEEIARRGYKSLAFGPFKPVGFGYSKKDMPFAVVQLRAENRSKTLYSVVAFHNRMRYAWQERVLRLIPALRKCEIVRYGQMHRNIYLNAPAVLDKNLSLKSDPSVFITGALTGVEGYIESAASGIMTGLSVLSFIKNKEFLPPPDMTAMGLLYRYIIGEISTVKEYTPTNINKGLFLHNGVKRYSENMASEALIKIDEYITYLKNYII